MTSLIQMDRTMGTEEEDSMYTPFKDSHDEDLMLAAEIGKSLLERNRELEMVLKATQEFAEEQCAQADFYVKQMEIIREKNEETTRTCEQLESSNQMLLDKNDQWASEYKLLEGKNTRLWDTINNLEKQVEELTSELGRVNECLEGINKEREEEEECIQRTPPKTPIVNHPMFELHPPPPHTIQPTLPSPCELENETLKKQISELNIQQKLGSLEKGEIESQLEDLINENQLLYQKITDLNQEITEWESFAQREENYRRLANAFTAKHFQEVDADVDVVPVQHNDKRGKRDRPKSQCMMKARSLECLNPVMMRNLEVLKSPNLINNVLSSGNSSSILSELDTEYADLVKRYEALLEKFQKQQNKNPERTRKVQRAIQTLSMDFSLLSSPLKSTDSQTSPMKEGSSCNTLSTNTTPEGESCEDYRKMFSDIFAKLKETRY